MIVIFGASSDLGKRVTQNLLDDGRQLRLISRDPSKLDSRAEHRIGELSGTCDLQPILRDAALVVSCAHARHTRVLLDNLPATVQKVVLTGSAWRYLKVSNPRGQAVHDAEAAFLASGRNGVILHPTMIYGGTQERNIQRLIALIQRWPVVPAPGGGRHRVQPIYIADAAACVLSAIQRDWAGPHALAVAGPTSMTWRDMVQICMKVAGMRRFFLPLPLAPAIGAVRFAELMGIRIPVDANMLNRFREDIDISASAMREQLNVVPRDFAIGLQQALHDWRGN